MSDNINDGFGTLYNPEVPCVATQPHYPTSTGGSKDISLRDYFAAAALQGLLAYDADCSSAIGLAYHTADAMLDWRKKNP